MTLRIDNSLNAKMAYLAAAGVMISGPAHPCQGWRQRKTVASMPPVLVAKIKQAAKFKQRYSSGEWVAAAELDLQWHALPRRSRTSTHSR